LQYADNSYSVPPTTITTTDPFTGKQEISNQAGYYIQNSSIQISIKNQNIRSSYRYFDVRMRGHFSGDWLDIAHVEATNDFGSTHDSEYTLLTYALEGNNATGHFSGDLPISPSGGISDFQVQAQGWDNVPPSEPLDSWVMALSVSSGWSNIHTISVPDGAITISPNTSTAPTYLSPTRPPSPTVPEMSWLVIAPLLLSIFFIAVVTAWER